MEAATRIDTALRKKFGQHLVSIDPTSRSVDQKQNAANACSVKDSDGGRERSRTSDLYSVNVALYP
jgi:hypothetical protein